MDSEIMLEDSYRRHDTIQEEQHSWMSGFQSPYIAEA